MVFITLVLDGNEWQRVQQTAEVYWPHQRLDREVSRSEVTRRLLFGGLDALRAVSVRSQQEMVDSYAHSLQPPPGVDPQLPGASK